MVSDFIQRCWANGVAELVYGDLKGIRATAHFHKKSNSMIHNFWSHRYLIRRLAEKAAVYGLTVQLVNERGSSSTCPRCGTRRIVRWGRLFKCRWCRLEAHRDAVGAVNIGRAHSGKSGDVSNGAVACPSLLAVGA